MSLAPGPRGPDFHVQSPYGTTRKSWPPSCQSTVTSVIIVEETEKEGWFSHCGFFPNVQKGKHLSHSLSTFYHPKVACHFSIYAPINVSPPLVGGRWGMSGGIAIILALGVGHFPSFDCTESFRLVVPKNFKSVDACKNVFFLGAL